MTPVDVDGCFGWLHLPSGKAKSAGIVICPGLKTDDLNGYGALKILADALAEGGFAVLRLQYAQTGDSCDTAADDYWPTWQSNVGRAVDWLRSTCCLSEVAICGLRFGAMLACAVANQCHNVTGLVLLAPVLRGRTYVRQLQFDGYFKVGACLSSADIAAINCLDLKSLPPAGACESIVFTGSPSPSSVTMTDFTKAWGAAGKKVKICDFCGMEAFTRPTFTNHEPTAEISLILHWLDAAYPQAATHTLPAINVSLVTMRGAEWVEKPFWFGAQQFGILCEPRTEKWVKCRSIVLIGNSSADPHSAGNVVSLARHLAAQGTASLRFDFVGVGDSIVNGRTSHVFEVDRVPDFSAAVDALQPLGFTTFAATGLCSGAYHAYHAAVSDPRIGFGLMVNLPFFEWKPGFEVADLVFHVRSPKQLLAEVKTFAFWRTQFSKIRSKDIRLITNRFAGLKRRLGLAPGHLKPPFARDLARPVCLLFMTSAGDISNVAFERRFKNVVPPGIELDQVDGLDHSMHRREMASVVAHRMTSFMERMSPIQLSSVRTTDTDQSRQKTGEMHEYSADGV